MNYSLGLICLFCMGQALAIPPIMDALLSPLRGVKKLARLKQSPQVTKTELTYRGKEPKSKVYDYIVVGSSPSGCVITNRLTEDPSISVLLIEAGHEDTVIIDTPLLNPYTVLTDFNWRFGTEVQKGTCAGMMGRMCPWPSGKGPGGGTLLNAMIYTRGNFRDFDSWEAEGNPGWSYKDVLPYFNKIENMMIPQYRNSPYHGQSGYLPINYVPFATPLIRALLDAGRYLGFNLVDYNNPNTHIGVARIQSTTIDGERVSAGTAYLKPILKRNNFAFTLRSRATKVLIDQFTRRAYGVVYIKEGKEYVIRVRREVILAAGAFNSPQLLMLSGIGPGYHLADLNITLIQDLPVGDNLIEHPGMHGLSFLVKRSVTLNPLKLLENVVNVLLEYIFKGTGVLTSLGCEGLVYLKTKYSNSTEDYPDIELLMVGSSFNEDSGLLLRRSFGISDELYEKTYQPVNGKESFSIWPMLLYPQSRGYVRLKDSDPLSKVRIQHNFLTEEIDTLILVEGIKKAIEFTRTPSFQKFGARLYTKPYPQCVHLPFGTDSYWECAVRTVTTQFHHQSGTCKMGTVVDSRLRVFGVAGLRVADASIMPTITGGHTQAPAYMIGEKAADLIKEDWENCRLSSQLNGLYPN